MRYELVCLDAGFTLLSPRRTLLDALREVLAEHGITPDDEELQRAWHAADAWFWDEYHRPGNDTWTRDDAIEETWRRYHDLMLRELGMRGRRALTERILAAQFSADTWELYADVLPALDALRAVEDGSRPAIGVVSDWGSSLPRILEELGLAPYLDFVLASGAAGRAKPDPAFFRMALERAGVAPERAVMVGDSYQADVVGARSAGMDGILLLRREGGGPRAGAGESRRAGHRQPGGAAAAPVTRITAGAMTPAGPIVVDKFGGSVLRRPEDIAEAVSAVAAQRAAGLRPVVVVSAFEGVTDTILTSAAVLLADGGRTLRAPHHEAGSALARETDRALATGEALSAALFALGLQARGIPARSFSGAEAGIRTAAAHLGAEVRRVYSRPLRDAVASGLVPVVAGFQGIGTHGELTTLGRGGTDLSAVVLAVALRADRCELFKDTGGVMEADPHLVPAARFLAAVDARQLELLAELGSEVVHPVAVRRARRGRLRLIVRAVDAGQPMTEVRPGTRRGVGRAGQPACWRSTARSGSRGSAWSGPRSACRSCCPFRPRRRARSTRAACGSSGPTSRWTRPGRPPGRSTPR